MFRDMFSGSRAILFGLVFFLIVVGGSLLYSWHVHRMTDAEVAEAHRKLQSLKNKNEARTTEGTVDTSTVAFEHAETSLETDDAQISDDTGVSPIDETSEALDMSDAFLPDDFVSEEAPAEDGPVSPFGFGPYPEIPEDYPGVEPAWESDLDALGYTESQKIDAELLSRVLIKLWVDRGEGSRLGGSIDGTTKAVYPYYDNTIYVKRKILRNEEGKPTGFSARIHAPGNMIIMAEDLEIFRLTGETPPGVRVLQFDTDGIDAYQFLNLQP